MDLPSVAKSGSRTSMLHIVRGQPRREVETAVQQIATYLQEAGIEGTLFLGYPVLPTAQESIEVDALLLSNDNGLVVFIASSSPPASRESDRWAALDDEQDELAFALKSNLGRHRSLRMGRELAVDIRVLTVFPTFEPHASLPTYVGVTDVGQRVADLDGLPDHLWPSLIAALQRVSTMRPSKRRSTVQSTDSRGATLKELEAEIANLDAWQQRAAIESPVGIQRIRGLAGSGKTVVLALKAAYLHASHPDWDIAVIFYSRSLYQHFTELIERFTFEQTSDRPDWTKLRLLHAWGGHDRAGMYWEMARGVGVTPRDFRYARSSYGRDHAFAGVCREALDVVSANRPDAMFDVVLIDEGQDLPREFFELIYHFTRGPRERKRIYFAYDELQSLSHLDTMPSPRELFGHLSQDIPRVNNWDDRVLKMCYRNSPWALTLAHGLGLGIGSDAGGIIQHFDDPTLWLDVGYRVVEGDLELGSPVVLERDPEATPRYFGDLLTSDDAVSIRTFTTSAEQAEWVAREIEINVTTDELDHDDILVVLPDALRARSTAAPLIASLARRGIPAHLVGDSSSPDQVFVAGSIAIAHIHRSKGNEASMVYVLNADECEGGGGLLRKRNTLFTAMTRSKCWLRLCGSGPAMSNLERQAASIQEYNELRFNIPTETELQRLRTLHRDQTPDERQVARRAEEGLRRFLEAYQDGVVAIESLPADIRTRIATLLQQNASQRDPQD